jgi:predicted small secreted protein
MMKRFGPILVTAGVVALATAGCHNTFQGVKEDTRRDLDKVGEKLEKAGDKIDGHDRKDGG